MDGMKIRRQWRSFVFGFNTAGGTVAIAQQAGEIAAWLDSLECEGTVQDVIEIPWRGSSYGVILACVQAYVRDGPACTCDLCKARAAEDGHGVDA